MNYSLSFFFQLFHIVKYNSETCVNGYTGCVKSIGTMGVACSRLEPSPLNFGNFLKVFWPIYSANLEVIELAKLDLWLDQFTIVLLYACWIDMILFMPQALLALIFIFQKNFL